MVPRRARCPATVGGGQAAIRETAEMARVAVFRGAAHGGRASRPPFASPAARAGMLVASLTIAGVLLAPMTVIAQTDEIQVYDGSIAEPGAINLTIHNNFTPDGLKTPAFPGGVIPDKSWNGVAEWAYGVVDWFELGLYLPLYSISKNLGPTINGGKIRLLFAEPHAAERTFVLAVNFEFSLNARHWDQHLFASEIRPILGLHWRHLEVFVNPILDTSYVGGVGNLDFAPAVRVAYGVSPQWTVAVEEYSDVGPLRAFYPKSQQSHQVWAVIDRRAKWADIEAGVGFGLTGASDTVTLKVILSRDLYTPH